MIQLKNVTLRRGTKVLLDGASVTLNPGEKVGQARGHGVDKSTPNFQQTRTNDR